MKLRFFLSASVVACLGLVPIRGTRAQEIGSPAPAARTTSQDQPVLPVFTSQRIVPLPPEPQSAGSAYKGSGVQPSGNIRMQYARLYFELMSHGQSHRKGRVEITLRNGTRLEGRIVSVGTDQFTIRIASTKQETGVNFADLSDWELAPPNEHIALNVLAVVGLELLEIAKLPLVILTTLSGRCGC